MIELDDWGCACVKALILDTSPPRQEVIKLVQNALNVAKGPAGLAIKRAQFIPDYEQILVAFNAATDVEFQQWLPKLHAMYKYR